jgi:choline dehydrogenase-like flavoprotein
MRIRNNRYDYLIVGSGAGGATLAKELAQRKKSVLVIEAGKDDNKVGEIRYIIPKRSKEGVLISLTHRAGGSTVVSYGNGVRCLQKELRDLGIDLTEDFVQAEQEMHIAPIAERLLSNGSKAIMLAAKDLGYNMKLMPKFIDPTICHNCGNCHRGCAKGAKWTALNYLNDAKSNGAETLFETKVKEIVIRGGKAKGIRCVGRNGIREIFGDAVILAAGGIGTPIILQKSGIREAGTGFFRRSFGQCLWRYR